jgi:hypothetical protein
MSGLLGAKYIHERFINSVLVDAEQCLVRQPVGFRDHIDMELPAFLNGATLGPICRGAKVKAPPVLSFSGNKIPYVPIHINLSVGLTVVGGCSLLNETSNNGHNAKTRRASLYGITHSR